MLPAHPLLMIFRSNDLIAIGLVNAVIDVVRSSPSPTSPEARIGSRRREGGQSEVATA